MSENVVNTKTQRKIAIIRDTVYHGGDYYDSATIIDSITDWRWVTNEEYKILQDYLVKKCNSGDYIHIVEHVSSTVETFDSLLRDAKEDKIASELAAEKRRQAAAERRAKSDKAKLEEKRKLLKKLREELGEAG
jgi:hypothetical protein